MSEFKCKFGICKEENKETHMVTVDFFGRQWFCSSHWMFVDFLFSMLVASCCRKKGCRRNHLADFSEEDRGFLSVKFNNKYYDLCDEHTLLYEQLLGKISGY